jgi:PRTRC genetic system ThiF family protein
MKKTIHYINGYLVNPSSPLKIVVVGAGGTGSQLIQRLARVNLALKAFDHPGIHVTVFDDDIVSEANIGRQLFPSCDIGLNKAQSIIYRINRYYDLNWNYVASKANYKKGLNIAANILICCVDSIKARKHQKITRKESSIHTNADMENILYYVMDIGNDQNFGQVIMHNHVVFQSIDFPPTHLERLSGFFDIFPNAVDAKDRGPSCSLAEALKTQDLFINSTMAEHAAHMLYNMIRNGYIHYNVLYSNLNQMAIATALK